MAFARSTASSAESTTSIAATGPKVSSLANSESAGHVREQRRLEARPLGGAADEHLRAAPHRRVDPSLDRLERVAVDERADDRVGSFGSPTLRPRVFSASRATNSSATGRSTMIRRADMQICP